jgi:hypothetical protein
MFKNRQGEININYQGYEMVILNYTSNVNIDVKFLDNGSIRYKKGYKEFKKGNIKNLYHPEIYDEGYCGDGLYSATNHPKYYDIWRSMLKRKYNKNGEHYKYYKDVTICQDWHNFQNFGKWVEKNYIEGWHLDKDLLSLGDKIYSPETCCFLPAEINTFLIKPKNNRTVGIKKVKKGYCVKIIKNKISINLGYFSTFECALNTYKLAKKQHLLEIIEKYRDKITKDVYKELINFDISRIV